MTEIVLAGNPNTGKSSLFNMLTGSYEYVGNWSGVTVEKKVGKLKRELGRLTDLPGLYSLNPISEDEAVASRFLMEEPFDFILNVVDASQLERNLHLTIQLLEFGKPLIIGLNMMDVAKQRGRHVQPDQLSALLGVQVVPLVARSGKGTDSLLNELAAATRRTGRGKDNFAVDEEPLSDHKPYIVPYGELLEGAINQLIRRMPPDIRYPRWMAIQFLEGNPVVRGWLESRVHAGELDDLREQTKRAAAIRFGAKDLSAYIRKKRAAHITMLASRCVVKTKGERHSLTDRIDRITTHKYMGIPVFLLFMYLTFKLTFEWIGSPLPDLLDSFINGPLRSGANGLLSRLGAGAVIKAVVFDGIFAGVGGVLVFVPQIFILFFIISLIEDSGYMARVAAVMDRLMESAGLNGKTFIPMIIGFGCNVPGIMAARTIEQPKERLLTIILTPLMSCSARLSVYSLFVGIFFQKNQALVVLSLYVMGIVVALSLAKLFSGTILKQQESVFVVELPPYRVPQWRTLSRSTWEKGKGFIRKAGTFIFGGSVLIWLLGYLGPSGINVPMDQSFLALIGKGIGFLLTPLGFGSWQTGAALITGFLAKEIVVSTMNIIYAVPDTASLQGLLASHFSPLQAYAFMAFILLYVPCLATVGVIRKETMSARWTWLSIGYALGTAYLIALLIVQTGRLLGYH